LSSIDDVPSLGKTVDDPIGHAGEGKNSLVISDPLGD